MKSSKHITYNTSYHLVFCTKYRRSVLTDEVSSDLKNAAQDFADRLDGFEILELEIDRNHVHMVFSLDPHENLHKTIVRFKGNLAHQLKAQHPWLRSRLPSLWTRSYYVATTGGVTLDVVRRYVENQPRS